jgi:hypothetical protein
MKMTPPTHHKTVKPADIPADWLKPNQAPNPFTPAKADLHRYGKDKLKLCCTEKRGYKTPNNSKPAKLVIDKSEGFIPLWEQNKTLHYRFNEKSMKYFQSPSKAKAAILTLFGEAVLAWGNSCPISFKENSDTYDFEIYMNRTDDGDDESGYVLASAFFPASGRDRLTIYPAMFEQEYKEQIETLIHEIGHIFGLRHFFAIEQEEDWPSEIYGEHSKFSIMNYGADSTLTKNDKNDLKRLYSEVWSKKLQKINGTPIVLIKPYHDLL